MHTKLLVLFHILLSLFSYSQEKRINVYGKITSDSSSNENIHIINQNTNIGTLSNSFGEFRIPVKEGDTIRFSAIQFERKILVISKNHLNELRLNIKLKLAVENLDEIIIRKHNLSGRLRIDKEKYIEPIPEATMAALDFSKIDFTKYMKNEVDGVHIKDQMPGKPDASKLTDPNIPVSGNLLGLLGLILDPISSKIPKIGKRKKAEKNRQRKYDELSKDLASYIRKDYGESFFTKKLQIRTDQIDPFLEHCKSRGLIDLYIQNKEIELIDLLFNESVVFLKSIRDE